MKRDNIDLAAQIPASLQEADVTLLRYGRWAMNRIKQDRCGSAEGAYVPGAGEVQEAKREAREVLMFDHEALDCGRALYQVPEQERKVLRALYIPMHVGRRVIPAEIQLRRMGVPLRLSQERHICGLRIFANHLALLRARKSSANLSAPRTERRE